MSEFFSEFYGLCRPPHRNSICIQAHQRSIKSECTSSRAKQEDEIFSSRSYFIIAFCSAYLNWFQSQSQPATLFEFHEYFRIEHDLRFTDKECRKKSEALTPTQPPHTSKQPTRPSIYERVFAFSYDFIFTILIVFFSCLSTFYPIININKSLPCLAMFAWRSPCFCFKTIIKDLNLLSFRWAIK